MFEMYLISGYYLEIWYHEFMIQSVRVYVFVCVCLCVCVCVLVHVHVRLLVLGDISI